MDTEFKEISENITIIIWKAKVTENFQFTNTYISPAVDKILGFTKGTINHDWNKYFKQIKPKYLLKIQQSLKKAILSLGETFFFEYEAIKANDETIWLHSECKCESKDGKLFVYGTTADVTDRKNAEKTLKLSKEKIKSQNKDLKKINAEKDKLFSIISHDLKSPFNPLIGFSDILMNNIDTLSIKKTKQIISIINFTAKTTYKLLTDLLEWANFHKGSIGFKPEKIDLLSFMKNKINITENLSNHKKIMITNEISENTEIFADKQMLSIITRNLITNAVKFTHKGGKITIFVSKNKKETQISVKDNGIGITPQKQNKLFRIENNISSYGTEGETGTGMGLILCREFVERHGGNIWVESQPKKGSTFTFTIPNKKI